MSDTGKVKNITREALSVPWLGGRLVLPGAAVDVPLADVTAYTQQESTWAPFDDAAKAEHQDMLDALEALLTDRVVAALDPEDTSAHSVIVALASADEETARAVLETDTRVTVKRAAEARLTELNPTGDVNRDDADDNAQEG